MKRGRGQHYCGKHDPKRRNLVDKYRAKIPVTPKNKKVK